MRAMTPQTRPISWIKAALKEFEEFPEDATTTWRRYLGRPWISDEINKGHQDAEARDRLDCGATEEAERGAAMKG
jgi:hypothetical protein